MTVASDLSSQRCPRSMLFAQIEGLEPILCERVDDPPPDTSSQTYSLTASASQALAVSGSGTTSASFPMAFDGTLKLYVGVPAANEVQFFERSGATWSLTRTIANPDAPTNTGFGKSVSADNGTVAIGAPYKDVGGYTNAGVVFVFTGDGTVQEQELTMGHYSRNLMYIGWTGRVHCRGDEIVIGDPAHDGDELYCGCIHYWTRTSTTWTEGDEIPPPSPEAGGAFASAVDFDGVKIIASKLSPAAAAGTVAYTFAWGGAAWALEQTLTVGSASGEIVQGVAINGDFAAAYHKYGSTANHLHIYEYASATWAETGVFGDLPFAVVGTTSPSRLRISDAGYIAYGAGITGSSTGVVYVYSKANGPWALATTCTPTYGSKSFGLCTDIVDASSELYIAGADDQTSTAEDMEVFHADASSDIWTTRSLLPCLRPPDEEWSQGLDLGEMMVKPSAMTFELDDIADPTDSTRSYFGRLFASGRWSQSDVARSNLYPAVWGGAVQYIGADDTSFDVFDTSAFAASGDAYIGQETFGYTSRSGRTFSGCDRGKYPAVGSALGGTYRLPFPNDQDHWSEVTSVPYSWLGRMIALYIVTYDELAAAWNTYASAELLWVGRITDRGKFVPTRVGWQLVAEHILKDLEKQIAVDLPRVALEGINLSGPLGRTFTAELQWVGSTVVNAVNYVTVDADIYSSASLWAALMKQLNTAANWSGSIFSLVYFSSFLDDGSYSILLNNTGSGPDVRFTIYPFDKRANPPCPSHALGACGFSLYGAASVVVSEGNFGAIPAEGRAFSAYHPLAQSVNGARLCCERAVVDLWTTQGDYGSTRAYLAIRDASLVSVEEGTYLASYSGSFYSGAFSGVELQSDPIDVIGPGAFAGQRMNDAPCMVEQIWKPVQVGANFQWRGPFEMLLYPILSTGTPGTNHGLYDALHPSIALGIPAAIVDTASFLEADKALASSALAERRRYVIGEPTTLGEMLQRECKLFGCFLAWDRGKLRLRLLRRNTYDTWTETLGDKDKTTINEWPEPEWSNATVVNCWKCKVDYDLNTGKYGPELVVRNNRSIQALRVTKSQTIEHPGVCVDDQSTSVLEVLEGELLSGAEYVGFPVDVVNASLAHTKLLRLAIGDVVLYTSARHYDPFGSGLLAVSCHALVVDLAWKFASRRGRATLLLLSRYAESEKPPWGCAALVDITAANGGWDATNKRLTLVPFYVGDANCDAKDGAAFHAGYKCAVVETSPVDPNAPLVFHPLTIAAEFEADGLNLLTLVSGPGSAWDPDREYCVLPPTLGDAVLAQQTSTLYLADPLTQLLSDVGLIQRWGG